MTRYADQQECGWRGLVGCSREKFEGCKEENQGTEAGLWQSRGLTPFDWNRMLDM